MMFDLLGTLDDESLLRSGESRSIGILADRTTGETPADKRGALPVPHLALQLDPGGHWRKAMQTASPAVSAMTAPAS